MAKPLTRLVLICGLPSSGKSTLARQLAPEIPAIRLDKDGWAAQLGADLWDEEFRVRLEWQLWELSQELLARGQSVILDEEEFRVFDQPFLKVDASNLSRSFSAGSRCGGTHQPGDR
jgi:predicted kinase